MPKKRSANIISSEAGFSLIELLIVMVILGLLAALVGGKFTKSIGPAKQKAAKAQIEMFSQNMEMFRLDVGRYPSTSEGLRALRENPGGVENWNGPYLAKQVPQDPWKHDYVYLSPGNHGDYDIISYGLDGTDGGEEESQDIVSWKGINQ